MSGNRMDGETIAVFGPGRGSCRQGPDLARRRKNAAQALTLPLPWRPLPEELRVGDLHYPYFTSPAAHSQTGSAGTELCDMPRRRADGQAGSGCGMKVDETSADFGDYAYVRLYGRIYSYVKRVAIAELPQPLKRVHE